MGNLLWLEYVFIQIYKSRDLTLLSGWNTDFVFFIFLVETQLLSQNWFCIWLGSLATRLIGLRRNWWRTKPRQCLSMWLNFLTGCLGWNSVSFSLMQLRCTCIVVHLYLNNRKQLRCIHNSLACEGSAPQWETSFEMVRVCIVYRICCILKIVWHTL